MPKEFNPDAIDLNVRYGSVRKESLDPEMFPFDWFEFESPPTAAPTYDKHRLKLKDFAVLQATLEGPAFIGLDCAEDVNALDVVALDAAGDVIKADKGSANTANVIGFAATTTSSGDKVRVVTGGALDGFSGLTPNDVLYLDTSGGYTQDFGDLSAGDYVVALGVAVSEDEVQISITQPLLYEKYDGPTYAELQDGYNESGGTTTPSQVTIAECKPIGLNAITLNWDRQNNLTNFDHYEVQVSSDQSNWYSLRNDGTDWKDQLGEVTVVYDEYITHQNIPPGGTEDDPAPVTLYYRTRRVTKTPVQGEWSDTASATANLIESKYIKKDAVTSAKLIEDAVTQAKIAAGAVDTTELANGAITEVKIDTDAVTAPKIKAGEVVAGKLATDAVVADNILAEAVTTAKLAAGSVETSKLAAYAVVADKISANAVETDKLEANAVTAEKIDVGAVHAREMSFGSDINLIPVYEDTDPAAPDAELFDLSQPDCVGSKGTRPEARKEIVYAPGVAVDETGREYPGFHSPRMIGQSEAIFQASTNLIKDPEDLTTSNWTNNNTTDLLTSIHVDGKRLTKITLTASSGSIKQDWTASAAYYSVQGILRRGDATSSGLVIWDDVGGTPTAKAIIGVTWTTDTVSETTGSHFEHEWIDDDTVWFAVTTSSALTAATARVEIYIGESNGDYHYITAVQLEQLPYPTPYIDRYRWPTGVRPAVSPNYTVTMPEKFVFKVKIRPWFTYDTTVYHRFFNWYIDDTHRFRLLYNPASDTVSVFWHDGGTERVLATEAFDDSGPNNINSEIILFGAIDLSTQTGNNVFFAIVDGSKQAEDNNWDGTPDELGSTFSTLGIGHISGTIHADSLIEYAKFWQWDGSDLGTLDDETDIDRVTADLTSLFDLELEDYSNARYKPVSKQGAIGVFQKTTNLVDFSEDLTDASWLDLNANITPSLSDYYIDGKRFTKLLVTDDNAAYTYKDVETTTASPSFQGVFKKGNTSGNTILRFYDRTAPAARGTITITWSTFTVAGSTGLTNLEYEWIAEDIVWISGTANSVNAANDNEIILFPDTNEANGQYTYATAIMVEDIAYPTPYTPTERAKDGVLNYPFEMPEKFTLMFWVRPWFKYDTGNYHRFVEWFIDSTHRLRIYYTAGSDKIAVGWHDGGTERYLISQQFDGGTSYDDINQWIMVALAFDAAGGRTGSRLKVYADTIGEDTDFGGTPDAKTSSFPTLYIGQSGGSAQADSFISDLLILPNQLLTAEQMDRHYWKTRPWHSPGEVASFDKSVRIDRSGIRLHNAELNITDWRNRQILISNRDGLMAKDAAGKVIHDIPDAPITINHYYCGHILWFTDLEGTYPYRIYHAVNPVRDTWTPIECLTSAHTNVKAGIFKCYVKGEGLAVTEGYSAIGLRPKGSNWSFDSASNTPILWNGLDAVNAEIQGIQLIGFLICPIGDDNSIDYYFHISPSAGNDIGSISQLGVLI